LKEAVEGGKVQKGQRGEEKGKRGGENPKKIGLWRGREGRERNERGGSGAGSGPATEE